MAICKSIERRLTITRVASAALPGDLDESERHKFADCGRNRVALNAELDKMLVRAGKLAIFRAPWRESSISSLSRIRFADRLNARLAGLSSISIKRQAKAPLIDPCSLAIGAPGRTAQFVSPDHLEHEAARFIAPGETERGAL